MQAMKLGLSPIREATAQPVPIKDRALENFFGSRGRDGARKPCLEQRQVRAGFNARSGQQRDRRGTRAREGRRGCRRPFARPFLALGEDLHFAKHRAAIVPAVCAHDGLHGGRKLVSKQSFKQTVADILALGRVFSTSSPSRLTCWSAAGSAACMAVPSTASSSSSGFGCGGKGAMGSWSGPSTVDTRVAPVPKEMGFRAHRATRAWGQTTSNVTGH